MNETLPVEIPGYVMQGLAGRGGMGVVYRAEQIATRRPVAIKLLTAGVVDPARLASFRNEAATLAQLEHPHVVPLYDYGEHEGVPYLVVRFLSGGTVADRLKSGPIPLPTALDWLDNVAEALDSAHRRGITHRDVKPSNLLLDASGNVYLGDFGIAATAIDLASAPHSGSAAYVSPEQARGESPDRRSDVYSLAATAFEMVTGSKPYEAETAMGMMVRHMHDPIPSARALVPTLPTAVDTVIAAGMAKDPAGRPVSAGEFARRLRQGAGAGLAAGAEPPGPGPAPAPRRSRGWIAGLVLGALAVCLIGGGILGGGLAAWFSSSSPTPTRTASAPQATQTPAEVGQAPTRTIPLNDDFSDPDSGFAVRPGSDGSIAYVNGRLEFALPAGVELYSPLEGLEEPDVTVSVDARVESGPTLSEMGILCRWMGDDDFVAGVLRGDGLVSLWRKSGGTIERWVDWTPVPRLDMAGQATHSLQLTCRDNQVRLVVDGLEAAAARDPAPGAGTIGLLAGLLEPGQAVVVFDDLTVSGP